MKKMLLGLLVLSLASLAYAGPGYVMTGKKGIMRFVQMDEDNATDLDTYRQAIKDLCKPGVNCQVLFWTENAPVAFPFSHEQTRSKTAYWQYHAKKGVEKLYVDCKLFDTIEDAECL